MLEKNKNSLKNYIEINRQDNLQRKSGWHQRMQDIYVFYYQHWQDDSDHRRPSMWQKYTEKE